MYTHSIIGGNGRNKGALLMLYSTLKLLNNDSLKKVYIFTPFIKEDSKIIEDLMSEFNFEFNLVEWNQKSIIVSFLKKIFKIPDTSKIAKALSDSEKVIDISGISFVTNRGIRHLIYNILCIALPNLYKCKIYKFPQSIGPINGNIKSFISRHYLKKCKQIYARGNLTQQELSKHNIDSKLSSDLGFLFKTQNLNFDNSKLVGIVPSVVVEKYFQRNGLNYKDFLVNLTESLLNIGYQVIVIPSSYRNNKNDKIFNDSQYLDMISEKIKDNNLRVISRDLNLNELFKLFNEIDVCITSRFHGMIFSLIFNKPPIVLGWNYKYIEILKEFFIEDLAVEINYESIENVLSTLDKVNQQYKEYCLTIAKCNPKIEIQL